MAEKSYLTSEVGVAAKRRYPSSQVRRGDLIQEKEQL